VSNLMVDNVNILVAHIIFCKLQGKSKITELDSKRGFLEYQNILQSDTLALFDRRVK
jgi:hypothetical protein